MDVISVKEKISVCYKRLQTLDIAPTRANLETLLQTLYDLQEVFNELERMEADGRTETDPERQPDASPLPGCYEDSH